MGIKDDKEKNWSTSLPSQGTTGDELLMAVVDHMESLGMDERERRMVKVHARVKDTAEFSLCGLKLRTRKTLVDVDINDWAELYDPVEVSPVKLCGNCERRLLSAFYDESQIPDPDYWSGQRDNPQDRKMMEKVKREEVQTAAKDATGNGVRMHNSQGEKLH